MKITREKDAAVLFAHSEYWCVDTPPTLTYGGWTFGVLRLAPKLNTEGRAEAYKELVDTIIKYQVGLTIDAWTRGAAPSIPNRIYFKPVEYDSFGYRSHTEALAAQLGPFLNVAGWIMDDSETYIPPGEVRAPNGEFLCCTECYRIKPNLITEPGTGILYCRKCALSCPGCGAWVFGADRKLGGCVKCYPRVTCAGCSVQALAKDMQTCGDLDVLYCYKCIDRVCSRCNNYTLGAAALKYITCNRTNYLVCSECFREAALWADEDGNEKIKLEKSCGMLIPEHPSRPERLMSLELEINGGIYPVLADLYRAKLSEGPDRHNYHQGYGDFCYGERDGSLSEQGGEIIFSKMRLNDAETAQKLKAAVKIIRGHVKDGTGVVDLACGTHVHVDAHKLGPETIRNCVIVANYLEDVVYRLGAANYNRHRGVNYAYPLDKNVQEVEQFSNNIRGGVGFGDHHSVISLLGYRQAIRGCGCGLMRNGDARACNCALGKCTIEFRAFNGTASPTKIHAYLALCAALVAYSDRAPILRPVDLPPQLFNTIARIKPVQIERWQTRLEWMFRNLYFSESERSSLLYTIKNSDLVAVGDEFLKVLERVEFKDTPQRKYIKNVNQTSKKVVVHDEVVDVGVAGEQPMPMPLVDMVQRLEGARRRIYELNVNYNAIQWAAPPNPIVNDDNGGQ